MKIFIRLLKMLIKVLFYFYLPLLVFLVIVYYPYNTDLPYTLSSFDASKFYERAYDPVRSGDKSEDGIYVKTARQAADALGIQDSVKELVEMQKLYDKRILEVGSGSGLLQDFVKDYTGLDIASTAGRYYHKPFVVASADSIPFPDGTFDSVWSIWMLEHVSDPERVLQEMRRVLKPNGIILLLATWNCSPWAAQNYKERPYSDFGISGKIIKATMPLINFGEFCSRGPLQLCRTVQYKIFSKNTRLRFRTLSANYNSYLIPDSDAAISIDSHEVFLWFRSRGDECMRSSGFFIIKKKTL